MLSYTQFDFRKGTNMDKIKGSPAPLQRKLIVTVFVGIICLFIGAAVSLLAGESDTLVLSGVICTVCLYKARTVYNVIIKCDYDIIEGVVVGIMPKLMRRYIKVHLIDDEENEIKLLLEKRTNVKTGVRYKFYFKKSVPPLIGSEYFDAALSADCFLGYEAAEEYRRNT